MTVDCSRLSEPVDRQTIKEYRRLNRRELGPIFPLPLVTFSRTVGVVASVLTTAVIGCLAVFFLVQAADDPTPFGVDGLSLDGLSLVGVALVGAVGIGLQVSLASRRRFRRWERRYRLTGFATTNALDYEERATLDPLKTPVLTSVGGSIIFDRFCSTSPVGGFERGTLMRAGAGGGRGAALASYLIIYTARDLQRSTYQRRPLFPALSTLRTENGRRVRGVGDRDPALLFCEADEDEVAFALSLTGAIRDAITLRHLGLQIETSGRSITVYFADYVDPLIRATWLETSALVDAAESVLRSS